MKHRGHQGGIVENPDDLTIVKPHSGYQLPRKLLEAIASLDALPPGTERPKKPIRFKDRSHMRYWRTIRRRQRRHNRAAARRIKQR